ALEITVSGPVDETTGMVCNLADLDGFVEREILERFDQQNLNVLPEFARDVPTTENLCAAVYDILRRGCRNAHLEKVRMEETMMNSFEYDGGAEIRRLQSTRPRRGWCPHPPSRAKLGHKGRPHDTSRNHNTYQRQLRRVGQRNPHPS